MSSLSNIFNTGRRALQVQGVAMQVVGHNTANVNTEGFSRRRIDFTTAVPGGIGYYNLGTGVDIDRLARVRDGMLDQQIRRNTTDVGYWTRRDDVLSRVEDIFNELGEANIGTSLDNFWAAWQDLANDPENMPARHNLVQKSLALTSSVNRAHGELQSKLKELDRSINEDVGHVNLLTSQIAQLNIRIAAAEVNSTEASDLRDARDVLIENLSSLIDIQVNENENGSLHIYADGRILVQNDLTVELSVCQTSENGILKSQVVYGDGNSPIHFSSGDIKSLLDLRDNDLVTAINDLNEFAVSLANRVNAVHQTGYGLNNATGNAFFANNVAGADTFSVSQIILDNPSMIATASQMDAPGDNSLALALAGIQHEQIMNGGTTTLDEYYRNSVLKIASRRADSSSELHITSAAAENLEARRQSISGVSMDEEMTHMLEIQKAYDAAAKIIQTVDEMMQTIINLKAS